MVEATINPVDVVFLAVFVSISVYLYLRVKRKNNEIAFLKHRIRIMEKQIKCLRQKHF